VTIGPERCCYIGFRLGDQNPRNEPVMREFDYRYPEIIEVDSKTPLCLKGYSP
jgi:hypothetical protein